MQTQRELELDMVSIGKENADRVYALAEEKGRASSNPYASAIHRRFVEPLAKVLDLKYFNAAKQPGRKPKIQALVSGQDSLVVSYLAIRTILNSLIPEPDSPGTRLATRIGTTLYGEVLLRTFEDINPALFHVLTRDLKRRMSKDERHRINVFRHEAEHHGIPFPDWTTSDRALVGTAILREMVELELLIVTKIAAKGKTVNHYDLHPKIRALLENIKEFVSLTQPMLMPCIEPPKPWVTANDGGWHTQEMRRGAPSCIASSSFVEDGDVPQNVLDSINNLQAVKWRINTGLLSAVHNISRHFDVGDVISQSDLPKPPPPIWLTEGMKKEDMDELERREFLDWKRAMSDWYTEKRSRATKWGRFYESMRVANRMKDYDTLWFVWQADYRSRLYAKSRGVSPQGSDLQKALIEFKDGGLISSSKASEFWFKVNGANRFGYDSAELDERVKWVDDRKQQIIDMANDPVSHRDWTQADKPFQFLAWCFEYAAWQAFPDQARTHLPVGLDGSCNGLQHFSAMTRDPVGGEATNLLPGKRRDIYALVAMRLTEILRAEEESPWREAWLKHGITRKLTKRSVMTLPYGSTRYSCADFINKDYMAIGLAPEFAKDDYIEASNWLSFRLWDAISDVVVKGQLAMQWLQGAAKAIVEQGHDEIAYRLPSGFMVRQRYTVSNKVTLISRLHGSMQVKIMVNDHDTDKVDGRRHILGISPNFIHGHDASHMQRVINESVAQDIKALACIHDDYGTTSDKTQELYTIIREQFVQMYEQVESLEALADEFGLEHPDIKGDLDIRKVLESQHFFS